MRAAVPQIFSTSRAEAAVFRFPPLFYPVFIVLAMAAQVYLPVVVHAAVYLDLPLLVVVYWAFTRRNQATAAALGAGLGLVQDSLANLALGVNGIAETLIGYGAATLGNKIVTDHAGVRLVAVFAGYEFNRAILYGFERYLLGTPIPWRGEVTALAGAVNALLGLIVFHGLDRFRRWV